MSLGACVEAGRSVELEEEPGLTWLLYVEGRNVTLSGANAPESPGGFSAPDGAMLYSLHVRESELLEALPAFDVALRAEVELSTTEPVDAACPDGELLRPPNETPVVRMSASSVARLYALNDSEETSAATLLSPWPEVLLGLSLRIPLREPCEPLRARAAPFAGRPRLFEAGESLGGEVLEAGRIARTHLRGVHYLDDDHVFFAVGEALFILERGGTVSSGYVLHVSDPEFLPTPGEDQSWYFRDVVLAEPERARRRGYAILGLEEQVNGSWTALGVGVADFTVTTSSVSALRLRHLRTPTSDPGDRNKLEKIAIGPDGGFAAVGDRLIFVGGPEGPVRVLEPQSIGGASITFAPSPLPPTIIQDKKGSWWVGDLRSSAPLAREAFGSIVETDGNVRILQDRRGPRPISTTRFGELWERHGTNDWRKHAWWLPPAAAQCSSGAPTCGRPVARASFQVSDFGRMEDSIFHTFTECDFIFRTRPSRNECSAYLEVPLDDFRLEDTAPNVNHADARGSRILLGGDAGLLLELTLD